MGIRGISTLIRDCQLLNDYDLHDTTIIIDGSLLAHELYFTRNKNNHIFGGDFDMFIEQIREFFYGLRKCNVRSIVVVDGSLNPTREKLNTKLKRMETYVERAYNIYKNRFDNNQIYPPIANGVFCTQVQNLGVRLFRTAHESEYIICKLAKDFHCPVLSNDGDFFIENLPAGVLYLDALIKSFTICEKPNQNLHSDIPLKKRLTPALPTKYYKCKIFKLQNFCQILSSNSNLDLLPISVAILDTDRKVSNKILDQIPALEECHITRRRSIEILTVIKWLSGFNSVKSLLWSIDRYYPIKNQELIDYIKSNLDRFSRNLGVSPGYRTIKSYEEIEQYLATNFDSIFLKQLSPNNCCPIWLEKLYIDAKINLRFLSIVSLHHDLFKPLVEDFRYNESSAECVYTLNEYTYGILVRTLENSNAPPPVVHRFCRRGRALSIDEVNPRTCIGDQPLPTIDELEGLPEDYRRELFYKILNIEPALFEQMETCLAEFVETNEDEFVVNDAFRNKTVLFLLSIVYLMRQFDGEIYIEFIYAIFTNIMLSGYVNQPEDVPTLFKLNIDHRKYFHISLARFNQVPEFTRSATIDNRYNSTIVHYYNAFQNSFFSIELLLEILNLNQPLNIRYFPFTLKGTFIYNLTVELSKQSKPLFYLKENVLNRPASDNVTKLEFKPIKLFQELLQLVLANSKRKFKFWGSDCSDTVPRSMIDLNLGQLTIADEGNVDTQKQEILDQKRNWITRILDDDALKNLQ